MSSKNQTLGERMGIVETQMSFMLKTINQVNDNVKDINLKMDKHISHDSEIPTRTEVESLDREVSEMPDKLSRRFAGIWVEGYLKAVIFTVGGSVAVAIIINIILR